MALTPPSVGVLGGETREFSARFFDALGRPAVGETVQFVNDACGIFSNGSPVMSTRTDASGVASVQFVARNQGITCWVSANAGVTVRWDVLTFTIGLVHFETQLTPLKPRPGESYVLTVTPMAGAYRLYEADIGARIVAADASASISPGSLNSGQAGVVVFHVTPDQRVGDYQIELSFRSAAKRIAMDAPDAPWQDLWWGGVAQNGWGVSIVQHRDMLFTVIYAYDASGRPTWYVMPGGSWSADRSRFSGEIYSPRGAPFTAYDPSRLVIGDSVGRVSLNFVAGNAAELSYTIGGASGTRMMSRQEIAIADAPLPVDRGDMWWGGVAQNGWGMAMLQQYRTLFAVWFTYDASGLPTWMVMPAGFWPDASTYEGRVYRTSGSPWLGPAYDPSAFRTTDVGFFQMKFAADGTATFGYVVDGRSGTMGLSRQPF
ncbi:MAG: hypothetical protein ABIR98_01350 [Usitatibacter sp.]